MASRKRHLCKGYAGVYYVFSSRKRSLSRERTYYIRYRINGQLVEEKAGHQYRDGMTALKAACLRAVRMEGREPTNALRRAMEAEERQAAQNRPTIDRLWQHFRKSGPQREASAADASNYKRLSPAFGAMMPGEITTAMVEDFRDDQLAEGLAPQTVKHVLGLLRRIIRHAVLRGLCPATEPGRLRFVMPRVDNRKTECLTPAQAHALLEALDQEPDQTLASLVRLALATGMRRGALVQLQWDDVDMLRGFITLRGDVAKKRRTDTIPLSEQARRILEAVPRTDSPFVFPGPDGTPGKGLRALLERIKVKARLPEDFRPMHGLRHTYASWLASSGKVDLYTLQKLLTHENPAMTQRYAHLADEAVKRAAAVADDLYEDVLRRGPRGKS